MNSTTVRRSGLVMLATGALASGTIVGGAPAFADQPVDVSALDTGSYPTTPRAPFGNSSREEIAYVEGQRMGDYVTLPGEIDDDLTEVTMPTFVVRSRQNFAAVAGDTAADIPANDHLITALPPSPPGTGR